LEPCDSFQLSIPRPLEVAAEDSVLASASERVVDSILIEALDDYRTSVLVVVRDDDIPAMSSLSSPSS
jgi:hypothetical protein